MTDINLNNLPLAVSGKSLNRVLGTQVDSNGVSTLSLFPIKTLNVTGGRIARLTISTVPAQPGSEQPATLTVYTDDGNSYPVSFTIPPGAQGTSISNVEYEQDEVKAGEVSTLKLTLVLDNGNKLSPIEVKLPPGRDSLTITDTSVTQEPVVAGEPSKVTVTVTHSDGSKASYSYDTPPGAEGIVDGKKFVLSEYGVLYKPAIYYGDNNKYRITFGESNVFTALDDENNVLFSLTSTEGYIGKNKIALVDDVNAEASRAKSAEANLISGTLGLGSQSKPGRGLHTSGSGRANYVDDTGSRGDLAYYTDVQNETSRAQAAEADTVKTQTNDTDHKVDLLVYNYPGQTLASHDSQTGLWLYYNITDNSVRTTVFSDADIKPTTIRVYKNEDNNGDPQLILQNNGFGDFIGPSKSYVDKEISRAKLAESSLQAKGNYLENANDSDNTRKVVSFNTNGKHGSQINFPEKFSSDDVQISIATRDTTEGHFHIANYLNIDSSGFLLSLNVYNGNGFINETTEIPISVIAIGYK